MAGEALRILAFAYKMENLDKKSVEEDLIFT
jgi:hypothetical protein